MSRLVAETEPDAVFDQCSNNAFTMLREANEKVQRALDHWGCRDGFLRSNRLFQEDSRKLHCLQAAESAAGCAMSVLEEANADTFSAAKDVRVIFSNGLLNDHWLN